MLQTHHQISIMKKASLSFILSISFLLFVFLCTKSHNAQAQAYSDSTQRKNVAKFDLTALAWYNNAFNVSFERVLKKNQTIVFTLGSQQLKGIIGRIADEDVEGGASNASGYKMGGEYRFYLGRENRYKAPHGVYIGPYLTYHNFKNNMEVTVDGDTGPQKGKSDARIQVINLGFQAGYQFLINNRWSVDMSFSGLSMSHYRVRMNLESNFDLDESQINQDILNALMDRFPLLEELVNEKSIDETGKLDSWGFGYRYQIGVGYAFGGGNKNKANKKGNL
jgi:hypothetical protein